MSVGHGFFYSLVRYLLCFKVPHLPLKSRCAKRERISRLGYFGPALRPNVARPNAPAEWRPLQNPRIGEEAVFLVGNQRV
jgi:hypothetical protein